MNISEKKSFKVTACLLSWQRPKNMPIIVRELQKFSFIDEIIIWNNNADISLDIPDIKIINSKTNELCYGRYLCAQQAKNNIIYFQDDDILVHNIAQLFKIFLSQNEQLVHALRKKHYKKRKRDTYYYGHNALLGWGAFIKKEWLTLFFEYAASHPLDYLFKREADKYFTLLLGKKHHTVQAKKEDLPDKGNPNIAMYLDPQHAKLKALAIRSTLSYLRQKNNHLLTWHAILVIEDASSPIVEIVESVLLNDADYFLSIIDLSNAKNDSKQLVELTKLHTHIAYCKSSAQTKLEMIQTKIRIRESQFVAVLDSHQLLDENFLYTAEKRLWARKTRWTPKTLKKLFMYIIKQRITYNKWLPLYFQRKFWTEDET